LLKFTYMGRVISVFLIAIVVVLGVVFLKRDAVPPQSPVPDVYGTSKSSISNDWFPKSKNPKNAESLNLSAKSAILVDYDTGNVIYAKNPQEKLPAASTIKIMTAVVALENSNLSDKFTVSTKAATIGENAMGLTQGETLTLEELLYGAMLVSGNDAAVAISEGISQSEDAFVQKMNQAAGGMGLFDTKFVNASGLDDDGKVQYTTAFDLVTIARFVWEKHPAFRKIVSTYDRTIDANQNHKAFELYNDTNLLTTYPGVKGIKPGFTWDAGWCLVTYAENGNKKLLAVILGSEDRRGEMITLLDYGFAKFGIKIDHPGLDL